VRPGAEAIRYTVDVVARFAFQLLEETGPDQVLTEIVSRGAAPMMPRASGQGLARGAKAINLPAWSKVLVDKLHIAERHVPGGKYSAGRTVFPSTMNEKGIMRAIREAYKTSMKVGIQGTDRVLLRGQSRGLEIEMWFNTATKTIETAYPVIP
jgi:Bacterial EndoU nuclease